MGEGIPFLQQQLGGGMQQGSGFVQLPLLLALMAAAQRGGRRKSRFGGDYDVWDDDETGHHGDEDDYDEYDEQMGAADDAAIDRLLADDEDEWDEDDLEGIGANIAKRRQRLDDLKYKLAEVKAELAATPRFRKRRRKKLAGQIQRMQNRIDAKERKIKKKEDKARAKFRRKYGKEAPPTYMPGVPPPGAGTPGGPVYRPGAPPVAASYPVHGTERGPGAGLRIPFRDDTTGALVSRFFAAPGPGLRTTVIPMTTRGVAFGEFRVRGIDVHFQATKTVVLGAAPDNELLVNLIADRAEVDGSIQLLLQAEDVTFAAQMANGQVSCARTLTGIREDTYLDKTNTATIQFTFRQEITTTITNVEGTLTAALIVDRVSDRAAERSG